MNYWIGWAADSWGTSWGYDAGGELIAVYDGQLVPAGHWKHLFTPAQDANPPLKRVEGSSRVAVVRPEVTFGKLDAFPVVFPTTGVGQVKSFCPTTGSLVTAQRVHGTSRVGRPKLRCNARVFASGVYGSGATFGHAGAGAGVTCKRTSGVGGVAFLSPKAVQNLPEEILLALAF